MGKHTPGPWAVKHLPNGDVFVWAEDFWVSNPNGPDYRQEIMSDEDYPTKEADAHLIAAAPQLRAVVEAITDCYGLGLSPEKFCEQVRPFMEEARVLLQAADGEGA